MSVPFAQKITGLAFNGFQCVSHATTRIRDKPSRIFFHPGPNPEWFWFHKYTIRYLTGRPILPFNELYYNRHVTFIFD
ncbi:hypothetical protein PHYBLDRAFT_138012 [Phycomyces blakesleeanus NRRL 1555(-)]|uniref:Uncharacterized protein n=1 Tax=Phycomyces blakesleeanus (strain ATCC 8743b / DSM 1359 / FGSC 10004 / NBRC 33097 / NRRL 1555) TaxID=763407 RepID=A0A167QY31_PHYB8|nr:hypothetical protein PHYBLDRAFT_138012 [Phycomyces blakesleeanus NRRL 1555(-)]OAD80451.1 hypothetical protein PHYBLDRAFT_138012 [Phycomyces blakesleeanus NRRL 1555(-)]|eukprot:XP_018298491.1 hypothetical protein PHYBLDRAFT_138012 [Phycomyces blakesleeanus NRRL 1555(-)]